MSDVRKPDAAAEAEARQYLATHGVEGAISTAVVDLIASRPTDALAALGRALQCASPSAVTCLSVSGARGMIQPAN